MSNVNNILLDNKTLETLDRTCGVDHTSHTAIVSQTLPIIVACMFLVSTTIKNPFLLIMILYAIYELVNQTREWDDYQRIDLEQVYINSLPNKRGQSELMQTVIHQYIVNQAIFVTFKRADENDKSVYLIADFYDIDENLCSTVEFTKNFNVSLDKRYTIRSLINPDTPTARIKKKYKQQKGKY